MRGALLLGGLGLVLALAFDVPAGAEPRSEAGEAPILPILTMEEAIRIALEQHPRLEQSRQRTLAAQAQTDQAFSSLLPQVQSVLNGTSGSARSNTSFMSGAIIENPNSNQATGGFRLDQLIYDFGRTAYRIQARAFGAEAREYDFLADRAFTVLAVQGAYLTALKQARLMDIAEKAVEERRVIRDLVDALYRGERRSKVDLSLADVELKNAQLEQLQARNDYLIAVQQLRTAMGVGGNEPVRLQEPVTVEGELPSLNGLIAEAKGLRPELQAIQSRVKSTEAAIVSAERQAFPTINATASSGEIAISDQNGKWWYGAFAGISLPLYTGGRIESEIREARAVNQETKAKLQEIAQEVELQVVAAYHPYLALREKVGVALEQVAAARTALDLGRERFRLGLGSIVEVTQAEVAVTRAETSLVVSRFEAQIAKAALDYATGRTLKRYATNR